ncbi:myotubularin-related protein 4-like isoform X2 [Mercenaria mercenaria]|uniref:myotubularin-related protein 4-like isoform X2 n=1 Tax=Mercenaria mercenaria TaxID=6596 RepID=UPI001E1DF6EB|nr:myotubularin-related protein 4-like isoform X2 [Mercenaria mercenaria]
MKFADLLYAFNSLFKNGVDQEPTSMEHIKRSDVFPKKMLISEDNSLRVPFPLLSGESAEYLGRTADGTVVVSNFRLLIRYKDSFINVPLGLIEAVEMRDIFYLHIYCKDATVARCAFSTNEACQDWHKRLQTKISPRQKIQDVFAFAFHAWCVDHNALTDQCIPDLGCYQLCPQGNYKVYNFTKEAERMKFDLKAAWRYTEINKVFGLCSSYPSEHIVPKDISDENLKKVAGFRALQRFPSVVWRNCRNGAVLVRSSQPEMGFFGWRNTDDENLLNAIPVACSENPGSRNKHSVREDGSGSDLSSDDSSTMDSEESLEPKKMLIIDCRSYSAAFANRAKGGGMECPEYYQSCEVQFMNLANIHAVRKSFLTLRNHCNSGVDQASWLSGLENTKWLHNLASLLKVASLVVSVNEKEGRPVLVHCSDGWDRTPQIISLAELMLDPYYRTVEGFQVLVEREWLHFGHKFADRCGNGIHTEDPNERCPVFLQWLECVYQLLVQFPCQFEFTEAFLVKLVQHTYSCLFGTFLCNTVQDRIEVKLDQSTASVWNLLSDKNFHNQLFAPSPEHEVLFPATHVQSLRLWTSVYLSNNSSFAGPEETSNQNGLANDGTETTGLQKTRSCENLLMNSDLNSSLSRRKSDPNIAMEHCEQQTQKLLKDAMSGDTSCSSESVKSSENDRSLSENGDITMKNLDSPLCNGEVSINGNGFHDEEVDSKVYDKVENGDTDNIENGDKSLIAETGQQNESENSVKTEDDLIENDVITNGDVGNGHVNGLNGVGNEESETVDSNETKESEKIKNMTENNSEDCRNGNDIHEMNGHRENPCDRNYSPDNSTEESSENSIETISESEEVSDNLGNGANNSVLNGHSVEQDENSKLPTSNSINRCNTDSINSQIVSTKLKQRTAISDKYAPSMESSTDTVTEDLQNGDSSHTLVPVASDSSKKVYKVASLQSLCDKVTKDTIENTSSISTSTSDLSDSRVLENGLLLNTGDPLPTSLNLRCVLSQNSLCRNSNGMCKGVNVDTSMTPPLYPTPISPQSRNSTCPPTPGTGDGKSLESTVPRHGLSRHLDIDGLTKFNDPVQKEVSNMKLKYEQEITRLNDHVIYLSRLLSQHASACNGDVCNLEFKHGNESPGSCDLQSIQSNYSNAASDASWDQMDDPEVNVTRWVPDHMVTQCAGCEMQFTVIKRKHHCRNCGKIFCHSCCNETIPLPHQMINTNERVCQTCYSKLTMLLTKSVIEMDNGIGELSSLAAAASN